MPELQHKFLQQRLHEIQHRHGWLPDDELRALSKRIDVKMHRIHEVASSFPGYRLSPPPGVEVKVCRDMACHLRGATALERNLNGLCREFGGKTEHDTPRLAV